MNAFTNENMIFWKQNNKAAQYVVSLYIGFEIYESYDHRNKKVLFIPEFFEDKNKNKEKGDIVYQKIDEIYIVKTKTYYTFIDLVDISERIANSSGGTSGAYTYYRKTHLNYYVEVMAEDKLGNTIDKSELMLMTISRR